MTLSFPIHSYPEIQLNKVWIRIVLASLFIGVALAGFVGEYYFLTAPWVVLLAKFIYEYPKLIFWLFMLCLPISAEITLPNGLSLTLPDEPIMVGIMGIFLCILIYNYRMLPEWLWKSPLIQIIILQYIWTVITVLYAGDKMLAVKFLLAKTWFLSSFVFFSSMFIKDLKDIRRMVIIFTIPVLIHSLIAFSLHALGGFGYRESNHVVQPFYRNHVDYGSILSMVFPIILIAIMMYKKWNLRKMMLGGVLLFLMIAIFVAYSRAAILAAIFSVVIFYAIKKKLANWIMPGMITFFTIIIIFLSYNNKFIEFRPNKSKNATQETFIETVVGAFTGKDMSSMERFYRWIACVRMSQDKPIVGVGPNNWYEYYKPYTVSAYRTWVSRNEERSTTHNYFLLMLTEQGWPGMVLYTALIIFILSIGQSTYHRFTDSHYKYYTLATVMVLASAFVNNFFSEFLETHKVGGMFWIAVTILAFLRHKSIELQQHV